MTPAPKIIDILNAGGRAITGRGDSKADLIRGSDYESLIGPSAVIWSREDRRDEDLFNATRFHGAKNDDLTYLVKTRYGIDRFLDTHGRGAAFLSRDASGDAGTIWAGTRITIFGSSPKYYRTVADTPVAAGVTTVSVAIESTTSGPGSMASQATDLRLDDSLWDTSWTVAFLSCENGTTFEQASDLIARVRNTRLDQRVGQVKSIQDVCKTAGASQALVFRSNYSTVDGGLNVVYVGDAAYQGSAALQKSCFIALRKARVLGDHMQVLQLARVILNPVIDVYLATAPALNDIDRLQQIHTAAVVQYLGGTSGGFAFSRVGILSAIARQTPEVQSVNVVTPAADVTVLVSGKLPAVLNRYVVGTVSLRYH